MAIVKQFLACPRIRACTDPRVCRLGMHSSLSSLTNIQLPIALLQGFIVQHGLDYLLDDLPEL